MSGPYGTYTGIVRWFDPVTGKGYLLSLLDGEVQASMIGEGITAADENILLDANGLTLHDMTGASIVTPTFGVGTLRNLITNTESFNSWTKSGGTTVSSDAQSSPVGETASYSADVITFPGAGAYIERRTSSVAASPVTGYFTVWLKAASAGTVRISAMSRASGDVEYAGLDAEVITEWRRFAVAFTTSVNDYIYGVITRVTSGDLSEVYAWGANIATGVTKIPPYLAGYNQTRMDGVGVRGPLFIRKSGSSDTIIIGSGWQSLPSGGRSIYVGGNAGDYATGDDNIVLGFSGLTNNAFNRVLALGNGVVATDDDQVVFGSSSYPYYELFGGGGVSQAMPPDFRINATGGLGTDIVGAKLNLAGGRGTGTGAGGSVVLQTAPAGSTGSSQNALVDRITVAADGSIDFHSNTILNWAGPSGGGSVTRWRLSFGC